MATRDHLPLHDHSPPWHAWESQDGKALDIIVTEPTDDGKHGIWFIAASSRV